MAEKKITRKVISNKKVAAPLEEEVKTPEKTTTRAKKGCFFCQSKTTPSYIDIVTLRKFMTDRAKIVPALKSSLCSKHQRFVTRHIKYARHLSLLPFTPLV